MRRPATAKSSSAGHSACSATAMGKKRYYTNIPNGLERSQSKKAGLIDRDFTHRQGIASRDLHPAIGLARLWRTENHVGAARAASSFQEQSLRNTDNGPSRPPVTPAALTRSRISDSSGSVGAYCRCCHTDPELLQNVEGAPAPPRNAPDLVAAERGSLRRAAPRRGRLAGAPGPGIGGNGPLPDACCLYTSGGLPL